VTPREAFETLVSRPREAGTADAAAARAVLNAFLTARGYEVRVQPFTFQPASLNVLPLLGAGLGWLTLLEIPALLSTLPTWLAPFIWLGGLTALGVLAWGIGSGIDIPGAERREDANLVATRGVAPVRRWIVAHVDTKSQRHSLAGRLIAVWILLLAALVMTALVAARVIVGTALAGVPVAGAAGLVIAAGALAARGKLSGTSPGARDNATGVLAALVAADTRREDGIGYLFTGAEEFGLVGSRVFVRSGVAVEGTEVINLDTLTGRGAFYLLAHDAAGRDLARRLNEACTDLAPRVEVRRLPLGILVDSLPFARADAAAVTLSRLDWGDLRRIHTPADVAEGLDPATAESAGAVLASLR
jgi:hypothetical protein